MIVWKTFFLTWLTWLEEEKSALNNSQTLLACVHSLNSLFVGNAEKCLQGDFHHETFNYVLALKRRMKSLCSRWRAVLISLLISLNFLQRKASCRHPAPERQLKVSEVFEGILLIRLCSHAQLVHFVVVELLKLCERTMRR